VPDRDPARTAINVVIPTFQRCCALQRLLRALEGQTLSAATFEVVVGIDGSTDGTQEMLESFRAPHPLRLVWQPTVGAVYELLSERR
jgi:glycosyltransferase involved in cell wall biosynthesis